MDILIMKFLMMEYKHRLEEIKIKQKVNNVKVAYLHTNMLLNVKNAGLCSQFVAEKIRYN